MPKIESIRPGETIEASFERYPLADLLSGILRGNLSGRMTVFLHPEPRNLVLFREGVPCWVDLPDTRVSLVSLMVRRGLVAQERGLDILRVAEASGRTESALLEQAKVLPAGQLMRVKLERARAQLVRLFDLGAVDFSFTEGARQAQPFPTILQPLPVIFEGLCSVEGALTNFASVEGDAMYTLTSTYPRGVDPFEWGEAVEALVARPAWSLSALEAGGLSPGVAAAVLYVLKKVEMVEPAGGAARRSLRPKPAEEQPGAISQSGPQPPAGLVVHRRAEAAEDADSKAAYEVELAAIRERLAPYLDQSYYQILRVSPNTDPAQLDRSYRFQVRRLKEEGDPTAEVLAAFVEEAYRTVTDPARAEPYAQLVLRGDGNPVMDKERRALEAEPKVERAMIALAEDRLAEARFLLDWALELDPDRRELGVLALLADWLPTQGEARVARARELKPRFQAELSRYGNEPRLFWAMAWVLCALGDVEGSHRNLLKAPQGHPLSRKVQRVLDQRMVL